MNAFKLATDQSSSQQTSPHSGSRPYPPVSRSMSASVQAASLRFSTSNSLAPIRRISTWGMHFALLPPLAKADDFDYRYDRRFCGNIYGSSSSSTSLIRGLFGISKGHAINDFTMYFLITSAQPEAKVQCAGVNGL